LKKKSVLSSSAWTYGSTSAAWCELYYHLTKSLGLNSQAKILSITFIPLPPTV